MRRSPFLIQKSAFCASLRVANKREENTPHKPMFSSHARVFLVVATLCMLVIPLATLFLVKDVVAPRLQLQSNIGDAVALVSAVIAIQLVMFGSCYCAFQEDISSPMGDSEEEEERKKQN
ncbi:hypothetical protein BASA81_005323 [Batrachochytrium salamandrivorans]|nr:hypothetical protein BASA81_005323 [Batrachochytrium salamandrivorans]